MTKATIGHSIKTRMPAWVVYLERYFEGIVSLVLLGIIFIIIFSDIVRRTAGYGQTTGAFEVAIGLFIWMAWMTTSFALRHESHFRFTLFRLKMSNRQDLSIYVIEWFLWYMLVGLLFIQSIPEYQRFVISGRYLVGTPIQEHWMYLAIPVSMALLLLRITQNVYFKLSQYRRGEDIKPDAQIGVKEV